MSNDPTNAATPRRHWKRWVLLAALVIVALPMMAFWVIWSGGADDYLRRVVVDRIERMTNTAVELQQFHFDPLRLRVTLGQLTVHGREPAGTPPFFHADLLEVGLRIDSFWGRKFSVGDVEIMRPEVHVRIERDGSSNVPAPKVNPAGKPLRERVFELVVHRLRLDDGEMLFNDVRIPLVAEGGQFTLAVDYSDSQTGRSYMGDLRWRQMELAAGRFLPFPSDVAVRFQLEPDAFSVTQLLWTMPHTSVDAQFGFTSFANPAWTFRYRGKLGFEDIRTILRKPTTPDGRVQFTGDGNFARGQLALTGRYSADQIAMPYPWFHSSGMATRGTYHTDGRTLEVPDLTAQALGGTITGRLDLVLKGLAFRVQTHAQGVDLATVLAAVANESFPVTPLHWDGAIDVQAVNTWTTDFKQFDSRGVSLWTAPAALRPGLIPATAQINYHYSTLAQGVTLEPSEISTPSSLVQFRGSLAANNSDLEATFDTKDLLLWDDFIDAIRGKNAEHKVIAGKFNWQGRLTGPIVAPTFAGHVKGANAKYDRLYWDDLEGDMTYSPDGFDFVRARASRGSSSAQIELSLSLDDWSFLPESPWSFDVSLVRTDSDGLQSLFGTSYPAHGMVTGTFHAKGTRANTSLVGLVDVISPEAWGLRLDRARGEIAIGDGQVRISNAELRLLPPPSPGGNATALPPGLLTGNFSYRFDDSVVAFDLTGAALPLEGVARIQTPSLPIGGRLSFHVSGQGPLLSPQLDSSLRLVDLKLGNDVLGSFQGELKGDGANLALQVDSEISTGELHGHADVSLHGDYPVTGQITVRQLALDSLIAAGLHLSGITGRSEVDGQFMLSGSLLQPKSLAVDANLSRVALNYQYVSLQNDGPVQLQYRGDQVTVTQATLRGVDTNFHIGGFVRFTGTRAMNLPLVGEVNLRLLGGFVPSLDASGPAQVDASITGTLSAPRVTGRVHLANASFRYGDFPAGLSQTTGDFVFDSSRMVFDNVTAQAGGGQLRMSGAVTYSGGPMRYDLTLSSDQVRIRYPIGMSWLVGGALRLTGTTEAATLSGRVTVDRLLMAPNIDLASLLVSSSDATVSAPSTTSPFLRNLQFDVQADSTPNARLQWSSGSSQTEASLRLRGTWERPILLGNIRMLTGDMDFRGNHYRLTRGDINFVNPFRLDPVINIEATATIQNYEVTLDFTGPASHLTMSYRSDPPLPSSDIITLLALGQTGEESQLRGAAGVQTPEMGATTLLSEAVSSQLGGRIQRLFGISHFSVDPSYLATTTVGNPAARVTVQQQFARDLVITYSTDVTSTQQQVIQIEYAVRPDVSIVALRDENGTFGVDVVFKKRFK
jgi:translocation and assembly module TamB